MRLDNNPIVAEFRKQFHLFAQFALEIFLENKNAGFVYLVSSARLPHAKEGEKGDKVLFFLVGYVVVVEEYTYNIQAKLNFRCLSFSSYMRQCFCKRKGKPNRMPERERNMH